MEPTSLDEVPEGTSTARPVAADHAVGLSSGVIFLIATLIQAIGLLSTYFLTHGAGSTDQGKEALGLVQFYLFVSATINAIGDLRIGSAYTYFISRGRDPSTSTGTYLVLRLGMVLVGGVVLWSIAPFLRVSAGAGGGTISVAVNATQLASFGIFLLLPLLWSVSTVFTQLTVAQGRSIRGQYPVLIESIIRTTSLVAVAVVFFPPWGSSATFITTEPQITRAVLLLTLAYVPGAVVSTLYSLRTVLRYYSPLRRSESRDLFRFAWPLMGSLMLAWIAGNAISLYVVDAGGTAQYNVFNVANGFRILALAVPAAVIVPLFPSLANLHARELGRALRVQVFDALRFTAMAIVPGALALVVLRTDFLVILAGTKYAILASTPLAILAVSAIPFGLTMIISTALNSVRLQRLELYLTTTQVLMLFGTALAVGPPVDLLARLGYAQSGGDVLMAASIAILASSLGAFAVNTYFLEKHLRVRIAVRPILTITAASVVAFGAIAVFNDVIVGDLGYRWYFLVTALLLGFAAYGVALALMGELSRQDVRRIAGMVGLPKSVTDPLASLCWRKESVFAEPAEPMPHETGEPPSGPESGSLSGPPGGIG